MNCGRSFAFALFGMGYLFIHLITYVRGFLDVKNAFVFK